MKNNKEIMLIASSLKNDAYDYEWYVEYCKDNDIEPQPPTSDDYWAWVSQMTEWDYDDFFDNLKYSSIEHCKYMITFNLGLWNGNRVGYVEEIFDSLSEAIKEALSSSRDYLDYKVSYENGAIVVYGYHHDGTNIMTIQMLSKHGMRNLCDRRFPDFDKYVQMKDTFKRIKYEKIWE